MNEISLWWHISSFYSIYIFFVVFENFSKKPIIFFVFFEKKKNNEKKTPSTVTPVQRCVVSCCHRSATHDVALNPRTWSVMCLTLASVTRLNSPCLLFSNHTNLNPIYRNLALDIQRNQNLRDSTFDRWFHNQLHKHFHTSLH